MFSSALTLICYECICGPNDPLSNSQINKPYLWLYSFYSWTKCCHILELTRTVTDNILWQGLHSLCLLLTSHSVQFTSVKTSASHGQCVDCSRHMEHCNHIFIMPDAWLGGSSCSWPHLQSYRWSLCRDWADVMISPLPPRRSNSPQTQQSIRILTSLQSAAGPSTEQARG